MLKVGVTGGIGSGKTTVCRVFGVLGIPVFSSDEEGKRLLASNPAIRAAVEAEFGPLMYKNDVLDRKALATVVFRDPAALGRLNGIIHPAVRSSFANWAQAQNAPYVINEAAILVETGIYKQLDHLITVTAPEQERIARVVLRDRVPESEVRARMRNQASDEERAMAADSNVTNDGKAMVIPQVLAIHRLLLGKAGQ